MREEGAVKGMSEGGERRSSEGVREEGTVRGGGSSEGRRDQ